MYISVHIQVANQTFGFTYFASNSRFIVSSKGAAKAHGNLISSLNLSVLTILSASVVREVFIIRQ